MVSLCPCNLNGTHDAITDKAFEQDWALDATGNWEEFDQDTDATESRAATGGASYRSEQDSTPVRQHPPAAGPPGNDLVQTRDHNEANETGTIGATTGTNWADPSHDAAGNMTSMPKPSDLGNSISGKYDAWNRLVEVSDGGVLIAKFRYDGEGRRILKMFDTDSPGSPDGLDTYEHIFLSGQQVIETRATTTTPVPSPESLAPTYQNIWSPRYIDSLILRDGNTDTDGLCDDARVYYLADANFNVTALIDTAGDVVERYLYSPYGEVTILDPDFTPDADGASDYHNTTLYTGRTLDTATGLMYYRARYYHAQLGRFVGRDPIGYHSIDVNFFRYAHGNVLTRTDPFGLDSSATGPCEINLWVGDTWHSRKALENFLEQNVGPGDGACPSTYIGVIGCGEFAPDIPEDQQIGGLPHIGDFLAAADMLKALDDALEAAKEFAQQLCENRREFCDDGTPERYECGTDNQRCDSVTVSVAFRDRFVTRLLQHGIGPSGGRVPGLPNEASREMNRRLNQLHRNPDTYDCLAEDDEE